MELSVNFCRDLKEKKSIIFLWQLFLKIFKIPTQFIATWCQTMIYFFAINARETSIFETLTCRSHKAWRTPQWQEILHYRLIPGLEYYFHRKIIMLTFSITWQITGKALILDEIIKYVRTLQTQVEVISSKLTIFIMYLLSPTNHLWFFFIVFSSLQQNLLQ